jgi:hypothetical protein
MSILWFTIRVAVVSEIVPSVRTTYIVWHETRRSLIAHRSRIGLGS